MVGVFLLGFEGGGASTEGAGAGGDDCCKGCQCVARFFNILHGSPCYQVWEAIMG